MTSVRPLIALTCYLEDASWGAWNVSAALIPERYLDLFRAAGAEVVLLPPGTTSDCLDRFDGLALVGGADVNPERYGEAPHESVDVPRLSRDASEFDLYARARELNMPVLGICRGLQVMAIAHGGSLIQNLPDESETVVHRGGPGQFVNHLAKFESGSTLASLYGVDSVEVNSSHHQSVRDAGDLVVVGLASDGTVEACEDPSRDFCLGVQWHPEHPERREADLPLVQRFIASALRFRGVTQV